MAAIIQITFNSAPTSGYSLEFSYFFISNPSLYALCIEKWQTPPRHRTGVIQTPSSGNTAEQAAIDFAYYFNLDYNLGGTFDINRLGNVVTIKAPNGSQINFGNETETPTDWVTFVINNGTENAMSIVEVIYQESSSNKCSQFDLSLETTEIAETIEIGTSGLGVNQITGNTDNPKILTLARGVQHKINLIEAGGSSVNYPNIPNKIYIPIISNGNININITPSLNGATVTFNVLLLSSLYLIYPSLVYEYSLNNIDWQSENSFSGQANGSYTIYIRDQFGCKIQKDYQVTYSGTRIPFIQISRANFLSFSKVENIDNCSIHKTDENTLAFQSLSETIYSDNHLVQLCDITPIHFKSNFNNITMKLRGENEVEEELIVIKQSNNLNRYEAYDCKMYNYGNGLTGLYFDSGNTYDELLINNGDYTLNGNVPDFASIGNIIEVVGVGTFYIKDVILDSNLQRKVILFENNYIGLPVNKIVKCYYDLLPYEIYEAFIVWSGRNEICYDVVINFNDTTMDEVIYQSENIFLQENHPNTFHLRWFMNKNVNQDVFYYYGIEFTGRYRLIEISSLIDDEVESNITDETVKLNKSILVDGNEIEFDEIPRNMALTLAIALSCENLFGNGEGYIKKQSIKWESIPNTNLVKISAELYKTNTNYNNIVNNEIGAEIDDIPFNIPALVGTNIGLIKS